MVKALILFSLSTLSAVNAQTPMSRDEVTVLLALDYFGHNYQDIKDILKKPFPGDEEISSCGTMLFSLWSRLVKGDALPLKPEMRQGFQSDLERLLTENRSKLAGKLHLLRLYPNEKRARELFRSGNAAESAVGNLRFRKDQEEEFIRYIDEYQNWLAKTIQGDK